MSLKTVDSFAGQQFDVATINNPTPQQAWPNLVKFVKQIALDPKPSIQQTQPKASSLVTDLPVKALCDHTVIDLGNQRDVAAVRDAKTAEPMQFDSGVVPQGDPQYALFNATHLGDVKTMEQLFKCVEFSSDTQKDALDAALFSKKPVAVEWLLKYGKISQETLQEQFQTALLFNSTLYNFAINSLTLVDRKILQEKN